MVATVMGLIELGQYAGAISSNLALLAGMAIKWGIVKPIKAYIDQATYPIQSNCQWWQKSALDDVAQTVNRIESRVKEVRLSP
jgi:hypothetical protein